MTFDKQKCTEYIEEVFMNCTKDEMNETQLNDAGTFYVGAQWQAEQDEKREQKLLEVISILKNGLDEYANKQNWRYSANYDVGAFDAWLDFKPDHACVTSDQLGGYMARQALAKAKELENELR